VVEKHSELTVGGVDVRKGWVSVIIPTYNRAARLARAVESCFKQTHEQVEVIVVDDGSTDDTPDVLRELQRTCRDEKVLKVVRQEHQGASVARNLGLEQVSGEFVQFLDSDDCLLPEKFSNQLVALQASGCSIAVCDFQYVEEDSWQVLKTFYNSGDLRATLLRRHGIAISAPLIRTDSIPQTLRFRPELERGQDVDFLLRYFLSIGSWVYTPGVWVQYICHPAERISDTCPQGRHLHMLYWSLYNYWKHNKAVVRPSNKWMVRQFAVELACWFRDRGDLRNARLYAVRALAPPFCKVRLYGALSELVVSFVPKPILNAKKTETYP
jgi:glycosyltransferase involved in cell wall biosynthesis